METGTVVERKKMVDIKEKSSIRKQCELLSISRGSYYFKPKGECAENLEIMRLMDEHHLQHPYKGVLQMQDYLRLNGELINEKRVRRLLRKMGIEAIYPKRNLSKLGQIKYKQPYLLRNLNIEYSNQVWAIDISYIPMKKGFMYLTVIVDWYSRKILGWQLSNTLEAETQTEIMKEVVAIYGKPEIINSDQGSQYTSNNWIECMKDLDIKVSMDGKGRATDNAIVERIFRTLKQEHIYLNPTSKVKELREGLKSYIEYFNKQRTHQGISRQIPENYYQESIELSTKNAKLVV